VIIGDFFGLVIWVIIEKLLLEKKDAEDVDEYFIGK
jgi:hypothetical protein